MAKYKRKRKKKFEPPPNGRSVPYTYGDRTFPSQVALAEHLGVSPAFISKYKSEDRLEEYLERRLGK